MATQQHNNIAGKAIDEIRQVIKVAEKAQTEARNTKQEAEKGKSEAENSKVNLENFTARVAKRKCIWCHFTFDSVAEMTEYIKEVHNFLCSICAFFSNIESTKKIMRKYFEFCGHAE